MTASSQRAAWSVARLLTRASTSFVVLLLVVSATGALGQLVAGRARASELRLAALGEANTAMLLAMADAETGVRGYRLSQDREFLAPYESSRVAFDDQSGRALAAAVDASERDLVLDQVSRARAWFASYAEPVASMPPGRVFVSEEQTLSNKRAFDAYRAVSAELDALVTRRERSARGLERAVRIGSLGVAAGALVLALGVARAVHRRTRRALEGPLQGVVTVIGQLAAGDHATRADSSRGPGEVRVLARSVNVLADENDRLRDERAAAARGQLLALEIGRGIRDHLVDGDPIAEATSRLGLELDVDRVYVRLLDDQDFAEVGHQWHRQHLAPLPPEATTALADETSRGLLLEMYAHGRLWTAEDLATVAGRDPSVDAFARRTGASAALIAPIGAGDRPLGMLILLVDSGPRCWSGPEQAVATAVAADLGRAIVLAGLLHQQQQLVAQLQDLDRSKTDFLSTVSHELRTPLTSISGYVELIRDGDAGEVPPGMEVMLAVVDRNTARLKGLIEDLLTLSRIESGTFRVTQTDVVLADVVIQVAACLRPAADRAHLVLDVDPGDRGVLVRADAVQVERALVNLLSNAVKFTPDGGRVELRASAAEGWAVVELSDTGIGIPRGEQDSLFSRFFRASNATERAIPGTGLGLMIVRSIVEHHGGDLQVASAEGSGTTVTMRLPLTAPAVAPAPAPALAAGSAR